MQGTELEEDSRTGALMHNTAAAMMPDRAFPADISLCLWMPLCRGRPGRWHFLAPVLRDMANLRNQMPWKSMRWQRSSRPAHVASSAAV